MIRDLFNKIGIWFGVSGIFLYFCIILLMCLTPPITRDALIHHLAIPKLWINNGGFFETRWADFSYYPMNINLLYLACLYFNNDIMPKLIHFLFGLGSGWMIYAYLKNRYSHKWGLLGMFIFLSTPIVVWLSTSAYIDLGMTFLTTAGILGCIRWRDSDYTSLKWLLISSCCMGLAVGSKYNALIAWFILNLVLVFIYVRDTNRQLRAIKFGFIFFCITAVTASPWYIKNWLLTGNPFYPLFESYFQSLNQYPVHEAIQKKMAGDPGKIGFFQMRHILYGENFWETLLIPLRMFFQGEDNSYQYFQGRLNPTLIVFIPFIWLNKKYGKNNFLFFVFSFFFIFMAFFLTAKQVRYILPVLPALTILAVVGIKNVNDKLKTIQFDSEFLNGKNGILRMILCVTVISLLVPNVIYLKNRFDSIDPLPYVLKQQSTESFLQKHLPHYPSMVYINTHLPEDSVILTLFLGRRGYYLERPYRNEPNFGTASLKRWVKYAEFEDKFKESIQSFGITHILMRSDLVNRYLDTNFSKIEIERFISLIRKNWRLLYNENEYAIWEVSAPGF